MKKILPLLGLVAVTTNANGLDDVHFGLNLDGSSVYFEDFEGEGESSNLLNTSQLSGTAIYFYERDLRGKMDLRYQKIDIDASETVVSQDGSLFTLDMQAQMRVELTRLAFFWVGAGFGHGAYTFKNRYMVDNEGFATSKFKDLTGYTTYGIASINREFLIAENWLMGIGAKYEYHFNNHLRSGSIGISFLYR